MQKAIVIRADADTQIGTGHVMRCFALAQAWQDAGGETIFIMASEAPTLEERLRCEGMSMIRLAAEPGSPDDALQTKTLAHEAGATWLVADGYHFSADYQRIIKESGLYLLLVDDYGHASHYYADIVLNQNIYAQETWYKNRELYTQLILGTGYVLLRREFTQWRGWKREISNRVQKILVTLGGADPDNLTLKVVQALQQAQVEDLEVAVIVGASYLHHTPLQSAIDASPFPIHWHTNVTNISEWMVWADIAIAAGGTTAWELAFMGLPSLVLVLADNQRPTAEWMDAEKIAIHLGAHEKLVDQIMPAMHQLFPASIREQMSQRGRKLVDGQGCARVLRQLKTVGLQLRPVHEHDCQLLWEWANDPDARAASFSSQLIPWEQHVEWFRSRISDPNCLIYIAFHSQQSPIGQVRYDIDNSKAIISINLDRQFRNQGYGSTIIKKACEHLFAASAVQTIHAYVKPGNEASLRAFVRAGFKNFGTSMIKECQALHLVLKRQTDEPPR